MENKNYGEIFCQATEILAQHLIEQISFDRTILCTIVDDSEKNIGKYRVSNTDMTFDAYTSDTNYKIHDNVYVSIPGGDWNEQKLIVSKKANDSETMVEYINPYDRFINITNNIIPTNNLTAGLVANDINKKQILLWSYNSNEDSTLKSGGEVYAGYTRLALSGSFQTLLKSFDVRFGDYGLNLVIKTAAADSNETAVKVCNLSCADMTGNPYNYQGFFPQAKIFDISNINQVIEMELWFYQKTGSFKNAQGAAIPYENMSNNILVKDINVALGYDTQSFDKDTLILYTQDLTDYDVKEDDKRNHKKLEVRWIHKFDENGKIKVIELNDGIDYNLTFYRHSLGEPSHTVWSGVDWAFLSSQTVVEGEVSYDYNEDAARNPSYNTVWLKPDYNKAQERIKAILTYNNNEEVLFSSILTINNANEVVSQETVNAVSALNINCEDNSNGNYFLYRLDGRILDSAYSQIKRAFKLYFNTYGDTSGSLTEAESIEWIIPANNTMINLYPDQGQELKDDGFYHVKIENNNDSDIFNLYYTINSSHRQQNNNNTIKCVIVRNQIEYTAIKELTFGTAGTAGTDYTFVLDFADNRYNALTVGENKSIKVEATLYDYTGKKLDISDRTIEWSLTYSNYVSFTDGTKSNKKDLQFSKTITEVPEDNYTILKAVLTNWGDFDLEAYLPIPIRSSIDYQFISGATTIVYNSLGYLDDTFQNPYIIYKNDGIESIKGDWAIKSKTENDPCIPSLKITEEGTTLKPINIYVEDTMTQLCITGSIEGKKVWSQPIYVYQNKYPTSIINDWNGELTIDKDNNAILAAKIVAGKKDTDNTFTGVMMGDWRGNDSVDVEGAISEHTGIYGFQKGAASFGFRDNGTAFIGKAGAGRLDFNGEKSTIQSAKMVNGKGGMLLDFDDGIIELVQYDKEKYAAGENSILFDASDDSTLPISVGKDKKFKVDWEGKITATDGNFKGKVTAESGEIGSWKIADKEETLGTYYDKNGEKINTKGALYSSENYTYFFPDGRIRIGRSIANPKFEVRPDGTFNFADGKLVFDNDELKLKDVIITWNNGKEEDLGDYIDNLKNDLQTQLDNRAETWYQATDPSINWTTEDQKALHVGDLWHCTASNGERPKNSEWIWVKNGNNYEWQKIDVSDEIFDKIDGVASIFTTIPSKPVIGDLLIPTIDINVSGTTYKAGKVYKFNDSGWVEIAYTDDTALNSFIDGEFARTKRIGDDLITRLGYQETEIGKSYIISPSIGGGYLNIAGANGSKVIIDPNNITREDYIFQVHNGTKISVGIKQNGNAEFAGAITSGSTITGAAIVGGSILIGEDSDPIFKVNEEGATFKGNIIMTGGSIKWESIEDPPTIPDQITLPDYIKSTGITETSIQSPTISGGKIYGGEIYASTFYAIEGDKNTYATMESDGFKIYHGSTVNNEPKMKLVTENEGKNIVLKLGAGANDKDYENEGRLVFEKYSDHAEVYYMVNHTPYGFRFDSTGVTMLGGGEFNVGTQAYAVFG